MYARNALLSSCVGLSGKRAIMVWKSFHDARPSSALRLQTHQKNTTITENDQLRSFSAFKLHNLFWLALSMRQKGRERERERDSLKRFIAELGRNHVAIQNVGWDLEPRCDKRLRGLVADAARRVPKAIEQGQKRGDEQQQKEEEIITSRV
jgi:hypothetical protein